MPGGTTAGPTASKGKEARSDRKRSHAAMPTEKHQPVLPKQKRRLVDRLLNQKVRDIEPDAQAYMDLLAFERKIDATVARKKLEISEAVKRPLKIKQKLRIFISNTFTPAKPDSQSPDDSYPHWELRIEGRLLEDPITGKVADTSKTKRKFSSFFKSLVIELDKDMYGPDNHLVEWHRKMSSGETDGFQVRRPGDRNVRCTIMLSVDYQPAQFKLHSSLARLLGIHTQTRSAIVNALWRYIKTNRLQDVDERDVFICDRYMQQIFDCERMRFCEVLPKLQHLLMPPDPITINHTVTVEGPDAAKKTACYDIEVEVDDPAKQSMLNYGMAAPHTVQEIQMLDQKIMENIECINQMRVSREFFLSFAEDPQRFINNWLLSQSGDLKIMQDRVGAPEDERRCSFFRQDWVPEAVNRFIYDLIQRRRRELEQALRA